VNIGQSLAAVSAFPHHALAARAASRMACTSVLPPVLAVNASRDVVGSDEAWAVAISPPSPRPPVPSRAWQG